MIDYNPYGFKRDKAHLDINLPYVKKQDKVLYAPLNVILPFQLPTVYVSALKVSLVSRETGVVVDITDEMIATGLVVVDYENKLDSSVNANTLRNNIIYYGFSPLTGDYNLGAYYIVVQTSRETLYSNIFSWGIQSEKAVQIEWGSDTDLCFSDGNYIYFDGFFRFKSYITYSGIAKPQYRYAPVLEERNGIDLPKRRTRTKEFKLGVLGAEHLLDALSYMPVCDTVTFRSLGKVYETVKVEMGQVDWSRSGNVGETLITFYTDFALVTYGKNAANENVVLPSDCLDVDYYAVGEITLNSIDYNNSQYVKADGSTDNIGNNLIIIVSGTGENTIRQLYRHSAAGYTLLNIPAYAIVYDRANDRFRFNFLNNLTQGKIISFTQNNNGTGTIVSAGYKGALMQIWGKDENRNLKFIKAATFEDFKTGVTFPLSGYNAFQVRTETFKCGTVGASEWVALKGIGADVINDTLIVYPTEDTTEDIGEIE